MIQGLFFSFLIDEKDLEHTERICDLFIHVRQYFVSTSVASQNVVQCLNVICERGDKRSGVEDNIHFLVVEIGGHEM